MAVRSHFFNIERSAAPRATDGFRIPAELQRKPSEIHLISLENLSSLRRCPGIEHCAAAQRSLPFQNHEIRRSRWSLEPNLDRGKLESVTLPCNVQFLDIFLKKIGFRDLVKGASEPFGRPSTIFPSTLRIRKSRSR